jgi:DNA-binding protein Fis
MITIMIADDELKAKEAISKILDRAGYSFLEEKGQGNIIRLVKKNNIRDLAFIKDSIVELEDALFDENKGKLYKSVLEVIEKPLIEHILERTEGNQLKAARILGLNRNTIRAKIKKLGINIDKWKTQ